jgi:hypothetical protein
MNDHIPDPTKMINDGGPAFALGPTASTMKIADAGGNMLVTHYGMEQGISIRDYFAAAALQGNLASQSIDVGYYDGEDSWNKAATDAYKAADAMLKAREAK